MDNSPDLYLARHLNLLNACFIKSMEVEPTIPPPLLSVSLLFDSCVRGSLPLSFVGIELVWKKMHPPLTLHRHPMCAQIIEQFQKCHLDHPIAKFFGECTDLKLKLDRCFRQEKALKRKANFEESKKLKERLRAYREENAVRN
ncbi:unnamed protein product [Ilex paraguariensis]|uniref:COX assembly mitochondrial protein n=1 Tax=Ilex paraguariensis TaxID=185542 RepID=A0ABC8QTW3_9AQUA